MTGQLVHYNGVLWVIKGSGDMLDEKAKDFLVLFGGHLAPDKAAPSKRSATMPVPCVCVFRRGGWKQ